jgi:hypothetical protein
MINSKKKSDFFSQLDYFSIFLKNYAMNQQINSILSEAQVLYENFVNFERKVLNEDYNEKLNFKRILMTKGIVMEVQKMLNALIDGYVCSENNFTENNKIILTRLADEMKLRNKVKDCDNYVDKIRERAIQWKKDSETDGEIRLRLDEMDIGDDTSFVDLQKECEELKEKCCSIMDKHKLTLKRLYDVNEELKHYKEQDVFDKKHTIAEERFDELERSHNKLIVDHETLSCEYSTLRNVHSSLNEQHERLKKQFNSLERDNYLFKEKIDSQRVLIRLLHKPEITPTTPRKNTTQN